MNKIAYSFKAFLRRSAMSQDSLFLVVEGKRLDRHFYDKLIAARAEIGDAGYQIHLAEQIENSQGVSAGGKQAVLGLFDDTKRAGALTQRNNTGPTVLMFALDRDHDFVVGGTRRSDHVVYTDNADIEADAFAHGDDASALALALSLTRNQGERLVASLGNWMEDLAVAWRDWLTLCCCAASVGAYCGLHVSKPSWINSSHYGAVEAGKMQAARTQIGRKATFSGDRTTRQRLITRRVDKYFESANGRALLKGKLLSEYLLHRVTSSAPPSASIDTSTFKYTVVTAYLSTVDFSAPWASRRQDQFVRCLRAAGSK